MGHGVSLGARVIVGDTRGGRHTVIATEYRRVVNVSLTPLTKENSAIGMVAPVLSVDTAYDPDLVLFARGRTDLYRDIGAEFAVTTLGQTAAERGRVLRALRRSDVTNTPYRAVFVSSHGEPSQVLDDDSEDGILLSADFAEDELKTWAKGPTAGRILYFCSCFTAQGPLFDKLHQLGAKGLIGFAGEPAWSSTEGQRIWRDLDLEIVRTLLNGQPALSVARIRDHFLDRIFHSRQTAGERFAADLDKMKQTLTTMVIVG